MATQLFTFNDLKDILVNRVGLAAKDVVDEANEYLGTKTSETVQK